MSGGGAERQLTYVAKGLVELGVAVHVAVWRRGANWERLAASGAVVHELGATSAYDVRIVTALHRIVRHVRPDVIQAWLLQMEVLGGLTAMLCGVPWVFSERSSAAMYVPSLKNRLRQVMARHASAIVANSPGGDDYWRPRVPSSVVRRVVPNGVPFDEIEAARASDAPLDIPADRPVVLYAGRLEPEKNFDVLLPALERVLNDRPIHVAFAGDGVLGTELVRWADAPARRGRVTVVGHTERVWDLMKRAAVLVSPSKYEGLPNVVLEAMACGTPLVVSDIPAHRSLLGPSSAHLVPTESAGAFAAAIVAVLDDPAGAAARAEVARERAARYSVLAVAQQYVNVYEEILASRPRG